MWALPKGNELKRERYEEDNQSSCAEEHYHTSLSPYAICRAVVNQNPITFFSPPNHFHFSPYPLQLLSSVSSNLAYPLHFCSLTVSISATLKILLSGSFTSSSLMALFWSAFVLSFVAILSYSTSSASKSGSYLQVSSISAAPSFLPDDLLLSSSSPAPSPDISPLFPSPKGEAVPPSDSSLPTIPSSRSPPDPDAPATSAPDLAFPPSESPPPSSVASQHSGGILGYAVLLTLLIAS